MTAATTITVGIELKAPIADVWEKWTNPEHITKWNFASDDWHTPYATNDLRVGGRFISHMAAKDGSMGFDFGGTYTEVINHQLIKYTMDDNRKATVMFTPTATGVKISVEFDAETINPVEMQRAGWQAIADNFKKYAEKI